MFRKRNFFDLRIHSEQIMVFIKFFYVNRLCLAHKFFNLSIVVDGKIVDVLTQIG
jgi:hypothetical protein